MLSAEITGFVGESEGAAGPILDLASAVEWSRDCGDFMVPVKAAFQ
jgi:hypothetical protein